MKPAREPGTRQYDLHVSLTITSDLDVSPLYIGSMLLDGIFAIDDAGLLFPGVTWPPPQERLVDVTVGVEAIARPSDLPTTNAAYERLMGRARKRQQKLLHDIDDDINNAVISMEEVIRLQHGFMAQLRGLAGIARANVGILESIEDRRARAALAAAGALIESFNTHVRNAM